MFFSFDQRVCFLMNISAKSDRKKDKSVVSLVYEQNIICSQKWLDDIAHEQTITAGHDKKVFSSNSLWLELPNYSTSAHWIRDGR